MTARTVQSSPTSFTYSGNEMATVGGNNLGYDLNGNQAASRKDASTPMTLSYNWDNKLRSATIGSDDVSIKYDPAGNRIYKSSVNSVSSVARKYIVDVVGDLPVILLELEPQGNNQFEITKTYIYANSQILAEHDSDYTSGQYFYMHDRLGSVRQVINGSGTVVKMLTYNPYGETIEEQGTFYTPWKFTGQYYDSETNQYYLRARQYSPYLARFTGRDLIMGDVNEPLTLHRYLYCQNEPINWIDPSGLDKYLGVTKGGHWYIGVDVWEGNKKKQMKYDFVPGGYEWGGNWAYLGALINVFIIGPGNVSSSDFEYDKTSGVLKLKQSREADEKMKETLDTFVKNPPPYGLSISNCFSFSWAVFRGNYDIDFGSSYNDPFWAFYMDAIYGLD